MKTPNKRSCTGSQHHVISNEITTFKTVEVNGYFQQPIFSIYLYISCNCVCNEWCVWNYICGLPGLATTRGLTHDSSLVMTVSNVRWSHVNYPMSNELSVKMVYSSAYQLKPSLRFLCQFQEHSHTGPENFLFLVLQSACDSTVPLCSKLTDSSMTNILS